MSCSFLYFDMGGVLLSFSHEQMCRQMAEVAGVDWRVVWQALLEPTADLPVQSRFERGDLDEAAVYEHFCRKTGTRPDQATLFAAGSDMFAEMPESAALVRELLAAGLRIGILSNTNVADWRFVTSGRFPIMAERFEARVLSFEVGALKPERRIYDCATEQAAAPASEVFFTDDKQENVDGALAAGLDAVLFTSAAELRHELVRRDVRFA